MYLGLPCLSLVGCSPGVSVDSDAAAWASAVTANGGTVSSGTMSAVSTFCKSAKASGYWTKLNRINLFAGNQLAAALVPLKVGGGGNTDTNVNFVSGDYSEATGLTSNGTTKYLRTGLIPSASLSLNDTHLATYSRANTNLHQGVTLIFDLLMQAATMFSDQYNGSTGSGRVQGAVAAASGFGVGSRMAATAHAVYLNGSSIATSATSGGSLPTAECYVFALNNAGSPSNPTTGPCGAYSIGSGLSAADVAAYNTHMQAFQTALGRNV